LLAAILFILYSFLAGWALTRLRITNKSGIPPHIILSLFGIKLVTGVLYGYIYSLTPDYAKTSDSWNIYYESLKEYRLLLQNPLEFFSRFFSNPDGLSYTNFFGSNNSYWNDLKDQLLARIEGVMNLFSFGDYYVNVVFYSFISFLGSLVFFRCIQIVFNGGRPLLNIIGSFLIPSFLFWTGGMYKDGYLFLLMAIIFFQLVNTIAKWQKPVCIIAAWAGLFLLRNYVALLIVPAIVAWCFSNLFKKKEYLIYAFIYGVCILTFLWGQKLHPSINFPKYLSQKQQEFLLLEANSKLNTAAFEGNTKGVITYLPTAFNYGFLRPHVAEGKGIFYIPFAAELAIIYLLLLLFCLKRNPLSKKQINWTLMSFLFITSAWLLLGYTSPVLGALVRYRSIFMPLIVAPIIMSVNWPLFQIKKNNN
jgi:hypothetical protein